MPKFVVEADGYSIEFWDQNGLKYKNITLKPTENHRDMFKKAKNERKHYKTCIAEVEVNDVEDCNSAIKGSQKNLDELSFYLAFAFNHDVFFKNFKCYKVESGSKYFVTYCFRSSMYVGKMRVGYRRYNISPDGIQNFIDCGFSNFLNEDFNKRTGIRRAILWYNAGRDFAYAPAEITFGSYFIALEILADYFSKENPIKPKLSQDIYSRFKEELKNLYKKLGIPEWGNLHSDICNKIQRITIKEKITALLSAYDLQLYENVAHDFVDLRNKIFHEGKGDVVEEYGGWATILKQIEKLLVKLVLKILKCYDMDEVHSSIKKDDLLDRGKM